MLNRVCLCFFVALFLCARVLAHPGSGIAVDGQGQVFFIDTGGGVWKIDTRGQLTRHDGSMFHWMAIDPNGRFATGQMPASRIGTFSRAGSNPTVLVSSDMPIAIGRDGAFYHPEPGAGGRLELLRWTSGGARSVLATLPASTENGPLRWLNGLAAGPDGSIYYTENNAVRRVSGTGEIATVAAGVTVPRCAVIPGNEPAVGVFLRGLDVGADGNVYVAASGCGALLRIGPRGDVAVLLRTTAPWSPTAVAVAGADLYVLEYLHTADENRRAWIPRVRRLRADGTSAIIATVDRK